MPDYRRALVPDAVYFFTVNTYRHLTFLTDADVGSALREAIGTHRLTQQVRYGSTDVGNISSAMRPGSTGISITPSEPGEAWVRGTGEPSAVFELPSVCQTAVAASNLGKQHRIIQWR